MSTNEPFAWITDEAIYRLKKLGGNGSRGTVPIHGKPSHAAKTPLYTKAEPDPLLGLMGEALEWAMARLHEPSRVAFINSTPYAENHASATAALSAYRERTKG